MRITNNLQVVDTQNTIIKLQSDVIDELFALLMQHITADEAERLPVLSKIRQAAELRDEIPGAETFEAPRWHYENGEIRRAGGHRR